MNYQETINYLFNALPMYQRIGHAAYKADLDTTIRIDEYFGHPHINFKSIHIAGTNGKGSVSHMIASILQEAGLKQDYIPHHTSKTLEKELRLMGK